MEKQEKISKLSEKVIQSIVNPELADELKSVGFDEYAPFRYVYGLFVECDSQQRIWWYKNSKTEENECVAPTYQSVLQWLREKHNLCIYVFPLSEHLREKYGAWEAGICYCDDSIDATVNACGHIYGESYNKCLENAIEYCIYHDFLKKANY